MHIYKFQKKKNYGNMVKAYSSLPKLVAVPPPSYPKGLSSVIRDPVFIFPLPSFVLLLLSLLLFLLLIADRLTPMVSYRSIPPSTVLSYLVLELSNIVLYRLII